MSVEIWRGKKRAAVEVVQLDGEVLRGNLFLAEDERIQDAANSARTFMPFETDDGEFDIINKSIIDRIIPLENGKPIATKSRLPRAPVRLVRRDGTSHRGHLFLAENERVSDVLNGARAFVPFEAETGEFQVLNKSGIARMKPIE